MNALDKIHEIESGVWFYQKLRKMSEGLDEYLNSLRTRAYGDETKHVIDQELVSTLSKMQSLVSEVEEVVQKKLFVGYPKPLNW